jgi:uncharacterized membrane protein (DUF4010 family)
MTERVFLQLGIALLLGLLVGLQRERTEPAVAGIRTFPLITIFGTVCGLLSLEHGGWVMAAGLLAVAALFVIANLALVQSGQIDPGLTTEMAALLMFGVGAYLAVGSMGVAVAVGGAVAVLLQLKKPMHQFVAAIGESDIKAIMQFALISLVILPVLPNREYGPYAVVNPFKVWLMVVLIVGIGLSGYVAYKWLGARTGTLLGGLLGGLISSTATTVSFARRTTAAPASAGTAALVIMLASTVVFVRVLIEVAAVAPGSFARLAPPLFGMLLVCVLISAGTYFFLRQEETEVAPHGNPAELKPALIFAGLYAVVILAVAAAKEHFGAGGLYVVAVLSGLTDMDAITLSTANLVENGRLAAERGWRVILVASLANLVFKAGIVGFLGARALLTRLLLMFALAGLGGALILLLWPEAGYEAR